jgi:hypothetical protein
MWMKSQKKEEFWSWIVKSRVRAWLLSVHCKPVDVLYTFVYTLFLRKSL